MARKAACAEGKREGMATVAPTGGVVDALERYGHGGDWVTARQRFGWSDDQRVLDFSANLNPLGPPPAVTAVLADALRWVARYPDPACRGLRARLARRYGLDAEHLLVTNGGAEGIDLVVAATAPRRVGVIAPSFGEYEEAARKRSIPVIALVARSEDGFVPDPAAVVDAFREADLVFFGRPNNPTGHLFPPGWMRDVLGALWRRGTVTAVDEAFLDFLPDAEKQTVLVQVSDSRPLVVLRSFTKMFAIPGLRLGFAAGPRPLIARMAALQVPWSVGSLAQAVGEALMDETAFVAETRRWLARTRAKLAADLGCVRGVTVFPSAANYLLFRLDLPGATVLDLQEALGRKGILIRSCHTFRGLSAAWGRVAVRTVAENDVLVEAIRTWVATR